jgi:hypothetical protein
MLSGFITSAVKPPVAGAAAPEVLAAAADEVDDAAEVEADELADEDFDDDSSSLPQPATTSASAIPVNASRMAVRLC